MTTQTNDAPSGFLAPEVVVVPADVAVGDRIALAASRCDACGRVDFPRRSACSACYEPTVEYALEGPARLGNRTAVLHAPPGALVEVPYEIGVAEFSEGIAVLGLLLDGEAVTRGDELEVVSASAGDRMTYAFRPVLGR